MLPPRARGGRTFGRLDTLKAGREELEEREVVDVGREVAHPHRVVLLAGHEARALVVQLEADGLQGRGEREVVVGAGRVGIRASIVSVRVRAVLVSAYPLPSN